MLDFPPTYQYCRAYNSSYQDQQAAGGRGRGSGARGRQAASSSPARGAAPSPDRASPMYGRGAGRGAAQRRGNPYLCWVCLFHMQQAHAKTHACIVHSWLPMSTAVCKTAGGSLVCLCQIDINRFSVLKLCLLTSFVCHQSAS